MKAKAILFGFATWWGISLVFGGALFVSFRTLNDDVLITFKPAFLILGLAGGILASFLTGYVAGRIAKCAEFTHAAIAGAIVAALGLTFRFQVSTDTFAISPRPGWHNGYRLGVESFGFACALLGGWLAHRRNERKMSNNPLQPTRASARG
jgi:hypothetical protein